MRRIIGVTTADHVAAGLVQGNQLSSPLRMYPGEGCAEELSTMPTEAIAQCIRREIEVLAGGEPVDAVGIGFPGIVSAGVIEESPNLQQLKGARMQEVIASALAEAGILAPVSIYNDADIVAAGLAAARGQLDQHIRVWTVGNGIGFGVYPWREGVWEGGHVVVSLDPAEKYCGCGGRGHLEGIMGHRAMRLRFLDMEPEEVFENAAKGDQRCADFVRLWHQALAAATANSVHMVGPGKFYITGSQAHHVDIAVLNTYMHEMVKMSPLQGYVFEVVRGSDEIAILGAAVNAERGAFPE